MYNSCICAESAYRNGQYAQTTSQLSTIHSSYTLNKRQVHRNRPFYIYYHRDMDGIVSTVLLKLLLTVRYQHNPKAIKGIPVDFDIKATWRTTRLRQPAAVVDFLYHKDALIYYDHHNGPFVDDFKDHFDARSDEEYVHLEEGASSAARVLFADLGPLLRVELGDRFKNIEDIVTQADIIDNAKFNSSSGWFDCEFDLAKLNLILQQHRYVLPMNRTNRFCNKLVLDLSEIDCTKLLRDDYYTKLFASAKSWSEEQKERIKSALCYRNGVIFYNSVIYNVPFLRFYPYEIYPNACFIIAIYRKGGIYEVSVGRNPFRHHNIKMSIGELCEKFGGGGHQDVGGIQFGSYEEAYDASLKVVNILEPSAYDLPQL